MAEASDEILRHIEAQRSQLSQHVGELEKKVKTQVDWRVQMKEHPMIFVGLGLVAGLVIWNTFSD